MSEDVEFWWVVNELVDFSETQPPLPFPVQVHQPPGCIGYFAVFSNFEPALNFVGGDPGKVKCLKVTRGKQE